MISATDTLTRFLHGNIPLTSAMQLQAHAYDGERLELSAPLAANVNDKGTAFGGSLYNIAVLSGWSLLRLKLNEAGLNQKNIVIYEANTRYLAPVTGELRAACSITTDALTELMHTLQKKNRARITLTATIYQQDKAAVEFTGQYVVLD